MVNIYFDGMFVNVVLLSIKLLDLNSRVAISNLVSHPTRTQEFLYHDSTSSLFLSIWPNFWDFNDNLLNLGKVK